MHAFGEKPVAQMMGNPRSQSLKEVQNSTESWLKLSLQAASLARRGCRMEVGLHARRAFGTFVIDADRAQVTQHGIPIALRPKTFALLVQLADRAHCIVGKQELLDAVWPGLIVTDDSLMQAISELRGALGDRDHQLIKTIPKRGYLLDAKVQPAPAVADELPTAATSTAAPVRTKRSRVAVTLVGVVLAAGTCYGLWQLAAVRRPTRPLAQLASAGIPVHGTAREGFSGNAVVPYGERLLPGGQSVLPSGCNGSGTDSQSGELAACLPSFELMTPVC
jgi:DNA-binding winged helix-turn-helix (wHTH) protein